MASLRIWQSASASNSSFAHIVAIFAGFFVVVVVVAVIVAVIVVVIVVDVERITRKFLSVLSRIPDLPQIAIL